jgi:hypothetical protein
VGLVFLELILAATVVQPLLGHTLLQMVAAVDKEKLLVRHLTEAIRLAVLAQVVQQATFSLLEPVAAMVRQVEHLQVRPPLGLAAVVFLAVAKEVGQATTLASMVEHTAAGVLVRL